MLCSSAHGTIFIILGHQLADNHPPSVDIYNGFWSGRQDSCKEMSPNSIQNGQSIPQFGKEGIQFIRCKVMRECHAGILIFEGCVQSRDIVTFRFHNIPCTSIQSFLLEDSKIVDFKRLGISLTRYFFSDKCSDRSDKHPEIHPMYICLKVYFL